MKCVFCITKIHVHYLFTLVYVYIYIYLYLSDINKKSLCLRAEKESFVRYKIDKLFVFAQYIPFTISLKVKAVKGKSISLMCRDNSTLSLQLYSFYNFYNLHAMRNIIRIIQCTLITLMTFPVRIILGARIHVRLLGST